MTETMIEKVARAFNTYAVAGGDDWGYIYEFGKDELKPYIWLGLRGCGVHRCGSGFCRGDSV